ncbi:hypothetical protein ACH4TP_19695 [Streptomyces sp. NPDC021012]|uniref:hypothetical protein n=1 Tax=Streptomyces sp. NPDC021012 TaxID=3365107 RepID=UPI0037936AA2
MGGNPTYQNITATVRPPRCAVFINGTSGHWKFAVDGAIAKASEVWGGRYFLIIPTDGATIAEKFWELLEAYSPDHLAIYDLTFTDLAEADPDKYQEAKRHHKGRWESKGYSSDGFEEWFAKSAETSWVDKLEIDERLDEELRHRLSPFHFRKAIEKHITKSSGFGYPFTKIVDIAPLATRHIDSVRLPPSIEDPTMRLLVHSQTGVPSEGHYTIPTVDVKPLSDKCEILDLVKHTGGSRIPNFSRDEDTELDDDFLPNTPFGLSMLHLGQYYRADRHRDYEEPLIVVLGDTVDDFCLYYSLSRMHEGVKWLPLTWLRASTKALNRRRTHREVEKEPTEFNQVEKGGQVLANLFYELIDYGHGEKRIQLCSMSLNRHQLIAYRTQVARCSYFSTDEVAASIDCIPAEEVSTSCILRVFETNNYVNHRSMAFVDGVSVSPVDTPTVKNFSEIRLPNHYWLTSLRIEGYHPPSLPTLGPKIVNLHGSTTESRIANDGIVYQCPNSMIFSNDLDAVLVRPKVQMPDVMALFDNYFEGVGVSVRYSDKGNYFVDTLRRFGGLEATGSFIKAPASRSVLDKFMAKRVADGGNIIYLENDQRAYLNLNAITASLGDEKVAADLVDTLVGKEVIQRGYIFQCLRCRLVSWYGMDVLANDFTCNRCGLRQQFTREHWRNPVVPHWYYRLAETVYQFYRNNSHLTAQVLYKLQLESKEAFHYAPEIDLVNFPRKGKSREMDVACIQDGSIIFGECKTQPLHPEDVEKFQTLVNMPFKNPARIIFATTQPVTDQFIQKLRSLPNAEIFTRGDLYDD